MVDLNDMPDDDDDEEDEEGNEESAKARKYLMDGVDEEYDSDEDGEISMKFRE